MRRKIVFLVVIVLGFLTALPLKAYATPDVGYWPSYGADFEVLNVEQGSGPSAIR